MKRRSKLNLLAQKAGKLEEEQKRPNDDGGWSPDAVRSYHPELTRCDHCGVLDEDTEQVGLLENHEHHWLHPKCIELFVPPLSELVPGGAIITYDRGQTWQAWRFISQRMIFQETIGIEYGSSEERRNKAAMVAAFRERSPYPPLGPMRRKLKELKIVPIPENLEKTKASQKFWAQFNDEQRYWQSIGIKGTRDLLFLLTSCEWRRIEERPMAETTDDNRGTGFAEWLETNPEPSLQALVERFGSYNKITKEGWDQFDRQMEDWQQRYQLRNGTQPIASQG